MSLEKNLMITAALAFALSSCEEATKNINENVKNTIEHVDPEETDYNGHSKSDFPDRTHSRRSFEMDKKIQPILIEGIEIENQFTDANEVNETEESVYNWKSISPANTNLMPVHFIRNDSIFEQSDQNFNHKTFTGMATKVDKQSFATFQDKDWEKVMGEIDN